jgi:hypothetical protein
MIENLVHRMDGVRGPHNMDGGVTPRDFGGSSFSGVSYGKYTSGGDSGGPKGKDNSIQKKRVRIIPIWLLIITLAVIGVVLTFVMSVPALTTWVIIIIIGIVCLLFL